MYYYNLILFIFLNSAINCEQGEFQYKNKYIKIIEEESNYNESLFICDNLYSYDLLDIKEENNRDINVYHALIYNGFNIGNNVYIKTNQFIIDQYGNQLCKYLNKDKPIINYINCSTRLPFICASGKALPDKSNIFNYTKHSTNRNSMPWQVNIEYKLNLIQSQLDQISKNVFCEQTNINNNNNNNNNQHTNDVQLGTEIINRLESMNTKIDTCSSPAKIITTTDNKRDEKYIVIEGERVEFNCKTIGNPMPILKWYYLNKEINSSNKNIVLTNHSLIILNVSKEEDGVYQCVAINNIGFNAERTFHLQVDYLPKIKITEKRIITGSGRTVKLRCYVTGSPLPIVQWKQNGNQLKSDQIKLIANNVIESYYTLTNLNIKQDLGNYICSATNRLGTIEDKIQVIGSVPKNALILRKTQSSLKNYHLLVSSNSHSVILDYNLKLRCGLNEEWIRMAFSTLNLEQSNFNRNHLFNDTNYQYDVEIRNRFPFNRTCVATIASRNEFGWSDESEIFQFQTTHVCGTKVRANEHWQYLVSHIDYELKDIDRHCATKIISNNKIEINFEEMNDLQYRICHGYVSIFSDVNLGKYRAYCDVIDANYTFQTTSLDLYFNPDDFPTKGFKIKFRTFKLN